ncbi:citrate lyase beta subunit [bacterium]|nr:citrate lyase beta subunit [bacterium]
MNILEKKMIDTLKDMKENHHVVGIKAEFEAEGTRLEEALRLKEVVTKAGLDLTIKIGGCEAIKDMFDARTIGVSNIVAPMIETPYAMKKYVQATKFVFPEEERKDINFLINIETITGFENIDKIIESPYFSEVAGCVLGRVDMTGSMGLTREDINSDQIFNIANTMAKKMLKMNKAMIIGGGVSAHSLPFFRNLPEKSLTRFETRKIIFDAQKALNDPHVEKGILKAVGFELMWLRNKREFYKMIFEEDAQRLTMLEARYKKLIEEAGGAYA